MFYIVKVLVDHFWLFPIVFLHLLIIFYSIVVDISRLSQYTLTLTMFMHYISFSTDYEKD